MIKRSVTIQNHRTSISLENEFWIELKIASNELMISTNTLVSKIDKERGLKKIGLSSSIRIWIIKRLKNKIMFD